MSDGSNGGIAGKVAFVAGGYGGIGEAVARALAHRGATVIVAGRDADKAHSLAAALCASGGEASGVAFDARDVASIREAVTEAAERHGGIDFLVNSAGTQQIEPLVDVSEEAFDRVLDVNLKAAMFLAQAVARVQIAASRGGRHVHLLSVRAQLGMRDKGYSA
jgi:NAD(P)-dependent dehydrogenase (short-subunit alcohol dehydrogenase family)